MKVEKLRVYLSVLISKFVKHRPVGFSVALWLGRYEQSL